MAKESHKPASASIRFGYTHHYTVNGFYPPDPEDPWVMGMWGFNIELDPGFALAAMKRELRETYRESFATESAAVGKRILGMSGRLPVRFYEKSLLLLGVSVPGNACDLSADYGDVERLDTEHPGIALSYGPHNVDTVHQAAALLSIWTSWYMTALAVLSPEATP